ncbi:hypothetical protein F2Q69_00004993 [Brassica cretica]|uniref:Uncharacterized protein n=1 Tax=Brassica cretica TaxID=69181 RepID=A0A8S9NVD1_BRACR|nr:hypothetical protein F2Q69_00004993 [Brassica cretica]
MRPCRHHFDITSATMIDCHFIVSIDTDISEQVIVLTCYIVYLCLCCHHNPDWIYTGNSVI